MRASATAVLLALLLTTSGCFRASPGRGGNIALISVGATMMAGTLVKSQFQEEGRGGFVDLTPIVESWFLLTFFAIGAGTTATGIIGLNMKPRPEPQ